MKTVLLYWPPLFCGWDCIICKTNASRNQQEKVGQMFTVFYFKETGINARTECMTIKALQEMEIYSLMKSTCNINLIVSNLTISKLSLIYLTIWKQSSIYLTISKPASEKFPRAPASKIWSRSLSSFIEIWRKKGFGGSAVKVIHMIMNMANDGVLSMKWAIKTHACLNKDNWNGAQFLYR